MTENEENIDRPVPEGAPEEPHIHDQVGSEGPEGSAA
ncbi:MAG: hypothetical protein QOF37_1412, partial [Thermoleophilaceae bacterium]|nr:hypothetical protein [Thermoleophilaceae bacterium]